MQISHRISIKSPLSQESLITDENNIVGDMPNDLVGKPTIKHLIKKDFADIGFSFLSYHLAKPSAPGCLVAKS